jgi:acetylornithine deacetylase/succinyl-diaminopimelate desuccinylase-like protein
MFEALTDATRELNPDLAIVPYLGTGATDSSRLRRFGVETYGVLPFPMDQDDEERMHGHDERIPLASLEFGTKLLYGALLRVTRAR